LFSLTRYPILNVGMIDDVGQGPLLAPANKAFLCIRVLDGGQQFVIYRILPAQLTHLLTFEAGVPVITIVPE
jgi:hypothetical protein